MSALSAVIGVVVVVVIEARGRRSDCSSANSRRNAGTPVAVAIDAAATGDSDRCRHDRRHRRRDGRRRRAPPPRYAKASVEVHAAPRMPAATMATTGRHDMDRQDIVREDMGTFGLPQPASLHTVKSDDAEAFHREHANRLAHFRKNEIVRTGNLSAKLRLPPNFLDESPSGLRLDSRCSHPRPTFAPERSSDYDRSRGSWPMRKALSGAILCVLLTNCALTTRLQTTADDTKCNSDRTHAGGTANTRCRGRSQANDIQHGTLSPDKGTAVSATPTGSSRDSLNMPL